MITVKFMIFARSATIDSLTNSLSISEVIEELAATQVPAFLDASKLIILFERNLTSDPQKLEGTLSLLHNEKKVAEQMVEIDFQDKKKSRNRLIVTVPTLQVDKFGAYCFLLKIGKKEMARYSFNIKEG